MNTKECLSDADLGRLWEDDVTAQEKQALQQHIDTCPGCKERWQRMSAGAQYVDDLLLEAAGKTEATGECLSEDRLNAFIDESLNEQDRQTVEEHLTQCSRCRDALAVKLNNAYETEGDSWWSQYVAEQILRLFARIPTHIGSMLEILEVAEEKIPTSPQIIKLPIFEPSDTDVARLAAATGEGLSEQHVHQDDPPFDLHLVQFGRQVRIGVRAVGDDSPYRHCLGRLELSEADSFEHSRVIHIDKGEGQCVLDQADISALRPKKGRPGVRFVPIVTLDDLASIGSEAYKPIFAGLLIHKDPQIRKSVVEVVARIYGPQACSLLEPLADDIDESVRLTVQKALQQFPQP